MEHLKAILIKFVLVAVVLGVVLTLIFGVDFSEMLVVSMVLTITAYILGDLMIFKRLNGDQTKRNAIATMSDAGLAFVILWFMGVAMFSSHNVILSSIISALVIAAGEWFYHKYLDKQIFNDNRYYESDAIHNS